jgi:DNA anti-recombination protein RmuC
MIWFVIIYSIVFSVGCFLYITHIYSKKLDEITNRVDQMLDDTFQSIGQEYNEKFSEYKLYQKQSLLEAQKSLQKDNSNNLNKLNKELNTKLDNLAKNISQRPII